MNPWTRRCPSRAGYEKHSRIIRPVPGGGIEFRCSFCDRAIRELQQLHRGEGEPMSHTHVLDLINVTHAALERECDDFAIVEGSVVEVTHTTRYWFDDFQTSFDVTITKHESA